MNTNLFSKGAWAGYLVALFFILSAVIPYGCSNNPFSGSEEGKVIYDVTVEGDENINPMVRAMIPSEMICYFNENKTCMVISAGMGMFESKIISDASDYTFTTMLSAMGKKMATVFDKRQVEKNFSDRVDLKIEFTDEVKEIAGMSCRKAIVTDSTENSYPVFFTEELGVKDPNWSSPFREIEGMLMEYSMSYNGIRMKLKAREIISEKLDPSLFIIPEDYEKVTDPSAFRMGM